MVLWLLIKCFKDQRENKMYGYQQQVWLSYYQSFVWEGLLRLSDEKISVSLDTTEDGWHLIYTSLGLQEWSSLETFVLVGCLEFIRSMIITKVFNMAWTYCLICTYLFWYLCVHGITSVLGYLYICMIITYLNHTHGAWKEMGSIRNILMLSGFWMLTY